MSVSSDTGGAGKKLPRRLGGMAEALAIASDLGVPIPPVQKQFSELLLKAASDYGALTAAVADFQWCQNFKESPRVWGEMLHPIPAVLASCTRFFEAMSAMRDSFATLQQFRVSNSSLPTTPSDSS
ncbi:AUGMIN subunit 2-like [Musa acuminata AAA Group]|uniref:AUGMIN subunit 2-like n=1 Tax=Musa acuminata AAA Group TaxID=214697 RepID=UPI0008A0A4B7|nr:PREDICTED: AUGMIN subunit 2-like [Musa acuminata subsp. malaccensis]